MPNLINTDSAGNVFYNYFNPVIKGEFMSGATTSMLDGFFAAKLGTKGTSWNGGQTVYHIRFPAPGLEMKTGNITSTASYLGADYIPDGKSRVTFATGTRAASVNTVNSNNTTYTSVGNLNYNAIPTSNSDKSFAVINDYALVYCRFSDDTFSTLSKFVYLGWTRESVYTGDSVGVMGLVAMSVQNNGTFYLRPNAPNITSSITLSSAADTITSPPIVCTPGTDPGDGSETATDIVIRDADLPNNPVGKLWNCIDLPNSCTVGKLYKNTGNYDGDDTASEQDVYLCVMPWGTRKLGMRVWTEESV